MKNVKYLEVRHILSRDGAIILFGKEIERRNHRLEILKRSCIMVSAVAVAIMIGGAIFNKKYLEISSALTCLIGFYACNRAMDYNERLEYLKTISAFLKANNGKDELEGFEPSTFSLSNDDNNPTTTEDLTDFLGKDLGKYTKVACKELKMKNNITC